MKFDIRIALEHGEFLVYHACSISSCINEVYYFVAVSEYTEYMEYWKWFWETLDGWQIRTEDPMNTCILINGVYIPVEKLNLR